MILYLLRHGDAVRADGSGLRDADRLLSGQGEEDIRAVGRMLATRGSPTHVLTSPLLRAVQSGKLVAGQLQGDIHLRATENLSPGFRQKALLNEIVQLAPGPVLAIGHQPDMSSFLSYIIPDLLTPPPMSPGTIACIELRDRKEDSGSLQWIAPPELLPGRKKKRR